MEFTPLGKKLFKGRLSMEDNLGTWTIAALNAEAVYRLVLAKGALEIKALVDMGIVKFKAQE